MKPSKLSEIADHEEFQIRSVNCLEYAMLGLRLDELFQVVNDSIGWRSNTERYRIVFNKTPNDAIRHSGEIIGGGNYWRFEGFGIVQVLWVIFWDVG
jgi:hypothetical protein